jgi:hypothetical protein
LFSKGENIQVENLVKISAKNRKSQEVCNYERVQQKKVDRIVRGLSKGVREAIQIYSLQGTVHKGTEGECGS